MFTLISIFSIRFYKKKLSENVPTTKSFKNYNILIYDHNGPIFQIPKTVIWLIFRYLFYYSCSFYEAYYTTFFYKICFLMKSFFLCWVIYHTQNIFTPMKIIFNYYLDNHSLYEKFQWIIIICIVQLLYSSLLML